MSQNDAEDDIWDYKPLKKKKRLEPLHSKAEYHSQCCDAPLKKKFAKRTVNVNASSNVDHVTLSDSKGSQTRNVNKTTFFVKSERDPKALTTLCNSTLSIQNDVSDHVEEGPSFGDFCPVCQMPFSILVVQSQRWHVAECLDNPGDQRKDCPDGLQCSSTIASHYRKYSHTLLAHSRATNYAVLQSRSQERTSPQGIQCNEVLNFISENSEDSALNLSTFASPSSSECGSTTPLKQTNALLLLRSPKPEDIRKRKGWTPVNGLKSTRASQEVNSKQSTPHWTSIERLPLKGSFVQESSAFTDDEISYSPLSEFPADFEVNGGGPERSLCAKDENNESMLLFSEDELYGESVEIKKETEVEYPCFTSDQVVSIGPLRPCYASASSTAAEKSRKGFYSDEKEEVTPARGHSRAAGNPRLQSPQFVVLERLREGLSNSKNRTKLYSSNLNEESQISGTEQTSTFYQPLPSSSQTSVTKTSQSMVPGKGLAKADQTSCLKQTDIGVFFGLKPLKQNTKDLAMSKPEPNNQLCSATGEKSYRRGGHRRKQRPAGTIATLNDSGTTTDNGSSQRTQGHGERGGRGGGRGRGGRRTWNRTKAGGEPVEPKCCPFYKKIPGTKFVVDAFSYGVVEGITAYFLTHFHSDHYGGLKKSSALPIYCNKVTGNLVKSKLRVAEEHIHTLPMNTEVTVEGVTVILLDANHCPGAAMLLFFLPDGQIVLHTGDFRADPSMEAYPELLSCRVQTLYLDTTYCSPEYTFPTQQEVITFAANTAFECVTLQPRTLVVCGSYSVGKEKVFLALAEVLGSKVCLSQDKYNIMCCLDSKRIKQLITTDWKAGQVHVLPMMQLNFKNLQAHLSRFQGQYDHLMAFKPTGWTFSQKEDVVGNMMPQTQGNISIYGIPYSEHSSFLEMKRFVQWLQPLKIIPTVNVGSRASRKAMEKCFAQWLGEVRTQAKVMDSTIGTVSL